MQVITRLTRIKMPNLATWYLIAITLGVVSGLSHEILLQNTGLFISELFIKMFKCISLPIIALSLIVTLSQYKADESTQGIWQKTLFYTVSTTLIAASVAAILYWLIAPSIVETGASNTVHTVNAVSDQQYIDYLTQLIPTDIFSPFVNHQVMSALVVSMVMGLAIRQIPDTAARTATICFFKGIHGLFLVITGWIVKIIPLALFGFITATIVQLKNGVAMQGLFGYLSVLVLANLIQGLVVLPLFLRLHQIKPWQTLRGMLPALSVAFFSKSSAGTLPVTMNTIERQLGVSPTVSRFVLPLCTSINMNGCAAFIFTTVTYLMQNHGIDIGFSTMLLWIVVATIAAIGSAGVPMGCFFLSASLLTSMNVPITLLGLILPFYGVIDMIETALNVWSDACVTTVINEQHKATAPVPLGGLAEAE